MIITNADKEQNCLTKKHGRIKKVITENNTAAVRWIAKTAR
jgi:hypothetical protein